MKNNFFTILSKYIYSKANKSKLILKNLAY